MPQNYDNKWTIIYYQSPAKETSVYDFINNLSPIAQSKISNTFDLLIEFNIRLGKPHIKKLTGTELWELRILGSDNIRIFYVAIFGKKFLLLHGFIKKKQKTNKRDIKIAMNRLKEYKSRNNS